MSNKEKQDLQKVGVILEDRIVRIVNDDILDAELNADPRSGSYRVAEHISAAYEEKNGKPMPFSVRSLACEIYWHYLVKIKSEAYERKHGKQKFTSWLLKHMEMIDCGDQKADNNRFVWNLLAIVFPRKKEVHHAGNQDQQNL